MNGVPPPGYRSLSVHGARLLAAEPIAEWIGRLVEKHGSLYRYAQSEPGSRVVRGRSQAYVIETPGLGTGLGLVRWLTHGGLLAALTGDRFLSWGRPRPENELVTALKLTATGIDTPQVWATCVYPAAGYYRGEVLRAYHPDSTDLATILSASVSAEAGRRVLAQAIEVAARLAEVGVLHADFNAMNLLVRKDAEGLQVIDLEKAASCRAGSRRARRRMQGRLLHSLSRLDARSGGVLPPGWQDLWADRGPA